MDSCQNLLHRLLQNRVDICLYLAHRLLQNRVVDVLFQDRREYIHVGFDSDILSSTILKENINHSVLQPYHLTVIFWQFEALFRSRATG
jgi:hypothetical protein